MNAISRRAAEDRGIPAGAQQSTPGRIRTCTVPGRSRTHYPLCYRGSESREGIGPSSTGLQPVYLPRESARGEQPEGIEPSSREWHSRPVTIRTAATSKAKARRAPGADGRTRTGTERLEASRAAVKHYARKTLTLLYSDTYLGAADKIRTCCDLHTTQVPHLQGPDG